MSAEFSWKMDGELPSIESHLVDQRLLKIMAFLQSIPFPEGQANEEEEAQVGHSPSRSLPSHLR